MPYRPRDIYRGRRKNRLPLMIGLFIPAFLIVCAIVLFYVLQQFLVYDQTGVSLQLPFMATETAQETEEEPVQTFEPVTVQVVYEEPDFSDMDLGGWQELSATKARFIPVSEAASEMKLNAALANVSTEEYTGVILELKGTDGQLAWASTCDTAVGYGTAGVMDYTETVAALHERGLTAAAQISCFADELLASRNWLVALQTENGAYEDAEGRCWLDPYNRTVRNYIADLMAELSAMGFDEIILADLYHPVRSGWENSDGEDGSSGTGFTYTVTLQTEADPVNAVCQAARRLVEGMADTGTTVSAVIDRSSLVNGTGDRTGQDIELFWRIFARLYCPCDTWDAATALEYAGEVMNDGSASVRFVPVCEAYGGPDGFDSYALKVPSGD